MIQCDTITEWNGKTAIRCLGKILIVDHPYKDMKLALKAYEAGAMIQQAFHFLSPAEREFMMTGMTLKEQEAIFGKDES